MSHNISYCSIEVVIKAGLPMLLFWECLSRCSI